jgi:hypothetical protein
MRFHGMTSPLGRTAESFLVDDYTIRKTLSRIGFRYSMESLQDWEVEYLALCESTFSKLEKEELERKSKRK